MSTLHVRPRLRRTPGSGRLHAAGARRSGRAAAGLARRADTAKGGEA
jgi:hypothetical protein